MVGVVGSSPIVPTKQNPRCAGLRRRSERVAFFVLGMIPGKLPSARDFGSVRARGQAMPVFSWLAGLLVMATIWSSRYLFGNGECVELVVRLLVLVRPVLLELSGGFLDGAVGQRSWRRVPLAGRWQGLATVVRCLSSLSQCDVHIGSCLGKASFEWGGAMGCGRLRRPGGHSVAAGVPASWVGESASACRLLEPTARLAGAESSGVAAILGVPADAVGMPICRRMLQILPDTGRPPSAGIMAVFPACHLLCRRLRRYSPYRGYGRTLGLRITRTCSAP
jgi:hypothetical protein